MVTDVTSLTGNGLKDWLIQRVTAFYFAVYSIFMLGFFLAHPHLQYAQWANLFHNTGFKIASIIAVIALSLHAWVGVWTVSTDYIKCTVIRISTQMIVLAWLLAQLIWCLMIVWGR